MSDTENPGSTSSSGATWAMGTIGLVIAYLLSPMPVAKILILIHGSASSIPPGTMMAFRVVYWPLSWLDRHSDLGRAFYTWYERAWGLS